MAGSGYAALSAVGTHRDHVVSFARHDARARPGVVTVAARFPLSRPRGWGDTGLELPPGTWRDALGDGVFAGNVALDDLLGGRRPAAVLEPAG